jgi:phage gp46-like protein
MQDLRLVQNESGTYDLNIKDGDFEHVNSLDTALEISLLTNSRANSIKTPELRNGWLGDTVSRVENRSIGSLLWLVNQERLSQEALNKAVDYTRKALAWIIEDNLAANISVSGEIIPKRGIKIKVVITTIDGIIETRYYKLWELTGNVNK